MSYVRFVPGFLRHPKLARCSAKAALLWIGAVDYCVTSVSDGYIPGAILATLLPQVQHRSVPRLVTELVAAGLLERHDAGYRIHDYLKYNPSKIQVQAEQAAAKARYQRYRESHFLNAVTTSSPTELSGLSGLGSKDLNPSTGLPFVNSDNPVRPASVNSDNGETDKLADARALVAFVNRVTGRTYRDTPLHLHLVDARLREGWSVEDCRSMVVRKWREWKSDARMAPYARPSTLFNRAKLETYMAEMGLRPRASQT